MDFTNEDGMSSNSEPRSRPEVRDLVVKKNGQVMPPPIFIPRGPATQAKEAQSSGLNAAAVLGSLRRKWPIALLLGLLLGPTLAAAGWFFLKPQFPATAFLLIDSDNTPLAFKTADHAAGGVIAFKVYKNTQRQLFLSPLVLNSAIANENVRGLKEISQNGDPLQWLKSELKVTFPDDSEVMTIELATESAASSKMIVDSLVDAYLNEAVLSERNERVRRLESLEKVYAEAEGKVRSKRAELRQLADTLGTGDSQSLTLAQQTALQQYGLLQTETNKVTYDLLEAEGILESTRQQISLAKESAAAIAEQKQPAPSASPAPKPSNLEYERAMGSDPEFQRLASDVKSVQKKLKDKQRAGFGGRMTESLTAELAEGRETLKVRRDAIVTMVDQDFLSRYQAAEIKLAESGKAKPGGLDPQLETKQVLDVEILKKRKTKIEEDLARFEEEARNLGRSSIDVEMMRAEIKSVDEVLTRLSGEIEHTRIELKSGSRVSLISKASLIAGADTKKRLAAIGAGALGGLLLPFALFIGFDLSRKLLDDPKQFSENLKVEVLGTVPRSLVPMSKMIVSESTGYRFVDPHVIESVNSIVAMLIKKSRENDRQVIMVSSASPSEGKSSLAQHLWTGLSYANYKCILIDMDLRRPSIHRYQEVTIGLGTSDVISGNTTLEEATRFNDFKHDFMTAGSSRRLNLAAMASDALPKFFDDLRANYDFIIVDSPPILPIVDARIISEHVDGVVLSTFKDRSSGPQIKAAIELIRAHGNEILGIVLNGYSVGSYGHKYLYQADGKE